MISVETPPHSSNLTLLTTAKSELLITSNDHDAFLSALIAQASDAICAMVGYRLERMEVSEALAAWGDYLLSVSNAPVAKLVSANLDGSDQDLTQISIYEAKAGLLYRDVGWDDTRPSSRPWAGAKLWTLRYFGGWMLPGDDVTATTISAASADSSYNDSSSGFGSLLVAGDWINASSFTNAGNNGLKQVVSATAAKIVVDATLTTEAAGSARGIAYRTLPYDLERACLDLVKSGYTGRDRDPSVQSDQIGDVSVTYSAGGQQESAAHASVRKLIGPYVRHSV